MLSEISRRNKYTTQYHFYAAPKIKTNSNTRRVTDMENKWAVARREMVRWEKETDERDEEEQISSRQNE